jgi:RNA polymerase sigma factor (sigma-70 family)
MTTSTGNRLLPHLRRLALRAENGTTDAELLGAFLNHHDETAFANIVQRHGPMVLNVCRRIIGDPHLAEDAFQATFIVLASRAASVQPRELLGTWLYGVARRSSLKARASQMRQRTKEKQVEVMPQPHANTAHPEEMWTDLLPILDEELARLSDKHRTLLVLCDLEGRPQRQVARELKLPPATVANRLAAARKALAKRLTGRGIALSTAALSGALHTPAQATIPAATATDLARWACQIVTGEPLVGLVPPAVNQLSEGVLKMFLVAKLKKASLGVVSCVLFALGFTTIATTPLSAEPGEKPLPPAKQATKPKPETIDDLTFLRRVSLDIRGTVPTVLESKYFVADKDPNKRGKVTEWLVLDYPKPKVWTVEFSKAHLNLKDVSNCKSCHQGDIFSKEGKFNLNNIHDYRWGEAHVEPDVFRALVDWFDVDGQTKDKKPEPKMQVIDKNNKPMPNVQEVELDRHTDLFVEQKLKAYEVAYQAQTEVGAKQKELKEFRDVLGYFELMLQDENVDEETKQKTAQRLYEFTLKLQPVQQQPYKVNLQPKFTEVHDYRVKLRLAVSDEEFLQRAFKDIAGSEPSKLEARYFVADKDAQKRDKLIEWLLANSPKAKTQDKVLDQWLNEPTLRKKWVDEWKKRLTTIEQSVMIPHQPATVELVWTTEKTADRFDQLLKELLGSKRSDGQILEALMLATMGRFPTDTEKKLIVDGLPQVKDRTAAWQGILKTLTGTAEAKTHAATLTQRAGK